MMQYTIPTLYHFMFNACDMSTKRYTMHTPINVPSLSLLHGKIVAKLV